MALLTCLTCGIQFKQTNYNKNREHPGKYCSMDCRRGSKVPVIKRILKKIVIDPSGCHIWTGHKTRTGYGMTSSNGIIGYVHRFMWEWKNGPISESLQVDHLCGVTSCCNVEHLRICTARENTLAGNNMAARHAKKLVCPKCGGPYTTLQRKRGEFRVCMPCKKKKDAEYFEAHRSEMLEKMREYNRQRALRNKKQIPTA
jgi:hypothetical protein